MATTWLDMELQLTLEEHSWLEAKGRRMAHLVGGDVRTARDLALGQLIDRAQEEGWDLSSADSATTSGMARAVVCIAIDRERARSST